MTWNKLPPYAGEIHHGCINCSNVQHVADLDTIIAVGFGSAMVTKGNEIVFMERPNDTEFRTLSEFEEMARADPDHDWIAALHGPLHGEVYQRQGEGLWILVDSDAGFA